MRVVLIAISVYFNFIYRLSGIPYDNVYGLGAAAFTDHSYF